MAQLKSYRDLIAWQKALDLVTEVYKLTTRFPPDERFGLISQLRRAAVSVPANIAEGYGRTTRGEYLNQLSVARGSLNEVATLCAISERLGFASTQQLALSTELIDHVGRILVRLRQGLQRPPTADSLDPDRPPTADSLDPDRPPTA